MQEFSHRCACDLLILIVYCYFDNKASKALIFVSNKILQFIKIKDIRHKKYLQIHDKEWQETTRIFHCIKNVFSFIFNSKHFSLNRLSRSGSKGRGVELLEFETKINKNILQLFPIVVSFRPDIFSILVDRNMALDITPCHSFVSYVLKLKNNRKKELFATQWTNIVKLPKFRWNKTIAHMTFWGFFVCYKFYV